MMFDAAQVAAGLASEPFPFKGMDGELYELPAIKSLSAGFMARFAADDQVLAEVAPDAYEAMQAMPIGVTEQLIQAWVESGGELGKSRSPQSGTRSTSTQRSRTSRSAASTPKPSA